MEKINTDYKPQNQLRLKFSRCMIPYYLLCGRLYANTDHCSFWLVSMEEEEVTDILLKRGARLVEFYAVY